MLIVLELVTVIFFQAGDGIPDGVASRGLGDVCNRLEGNMHLFSQEGRGIRGMDGAS